MSENERVSKPATERASTNLMRYTWVNRLPACGRSIKAINALALAIASGGPLKITDVPRALARTSGYWRATTRATSRDRAWVTLTASAAAKVGAGVTVGVSIDAITDLICVRSCGIATTMIVLFGPADMRARG